MRASAWLRAYVCVRAPVYVCVCVWGWVHESGRVFARVDLRIQYAMRKRHIAFCPIWLYHIFRH